MNPTLSRREMLRRCLRYGALGSVGGVAAWLGARSLRDQCSSSGPCGNCPLFNGRTLFDACDLPKAQSSRREPDNPSPPSQDG